MPLSLIPRFSLRGRRAVLSGLLSDLAAASAPGASKLGSAAAAAAGATTAAAAA
eukprot:CAMPEP_0174709654 /NCGR_PEP_ID=MMETSP1094-20130205/11539_1 /TAXON_ID=156173 /ORGANISM="Chrysochromulina brevifilum, Strain UTEX LB 985" /LENGTH=53 /DNA_ID=CAMNT_0015908349 /DNA_START=122 /DNA_END=283 /DNA_ORIENTATION=+